MSVANLLTFSRLIATPFVIGLMYGNSPSARYAALTLFIVAMLTDVFDGPIARRTERTMLGNYLDPIADKTLILCVFICLGDRGILPLWMGLVLLALELIVSGVRDVAAAQGRVVGANWMGKTKTLLQVITISVGLFLLARVNGEVGSAFVASTGYHIVWGLGLATVLVSGVFAAVFLHWNRGVVMGEDAP